MRDKLIEQYERGIGLVRYAMDGLTPGELKATPGPGDWSTAQVVMHLMDSDLVASYRMKLVIAEDEPTLQAYDEQKWAARLCYEGQSLAGAAELFDVNRRQMVDMLRRLDDAAFERWGNHTERGRETLADIIQIYSNHLDHHLKFIYGKRERLSRPIAARYSAAE